MKQVHRLASCMVFSLAACSSAPPREAAVESASDFTSDRITVVTQGSGPDVILIPGLGSPRAVWDSVVGPLAANYRLHLVQLNGFAGVAAGANADGPVAAPAAEEIARYISATGLTKPAVIGHSMGGSIGMMLAARHPDLVGRLMVLDMPAFMGEMWAGPGATGEAMRPFADQIRAAPDSFVVEFGKMVTGMTRREALRPGLLQYVNTSDKNTVVNSFGELVTLDLRPELGRITAPTMVLYVVPAQTPVPADQFEAALRRSFANAPNTQLKKIENSDHFIQYDQPALLVREIEAFVPRT